MREPPCDRRHRRGLWIWPRLIELTTAAGSRRADAPAAGNGLPEVLVVGECFQRGAVGQVPLQVELLEQQLVPVNGHGYIVPAPPRGCLGDGTCGGTPVTCGSKREVHAGSAVPPARRSVSCSSPLSRTDRGLLILREDPPGGVAGGGDLRG